MEGIDGSLVPFFSIFGHGEDVARPPERQTGEKEAGAAAHDPGRENTF